MASFDEGKEYLLSQIPNEIIFGEVLSYFSYRWILHTARLVCKYWNDHYKTIKTNQFQITYKGNIEKMIVMMNEHSDELHQVTDLSLYEPNKLNVELEKEFISKLINLQKLQFASIGNCDISIIKEFVKLKTLKQLDVCNFEHFEEFMKFCPSQFKSVRLPYCFKNDWGQVNFDNLNWPLEEFFCSCALNSESVISFLKNWIMIKNLKKLEISNRYLDENVMKELSKVSKLTELNLLNAKCGDVGVQYISQLENLESLNLNNNSILGSGLSNFGKLTNITRLYLSFNSIDDEGANYLSSLSNLTYLSLEENKISDEGLRNYSKLSNLSHLDLNNNQIGSVGANYLYQITSLNYLYLNNNLIGEEGLKNFGNLSKLRALYLENNKIGDGFQYLSEFKDTFLNLSSNNINEESVLKYCKNKPSLLAFNISNNPIGNSGFVSLMKLPTLTALDANNCGISDEGISKMLEILSTSKPNQDISISVRVNHFTNSSLKKILKAENIGKLTLTISNSTQFAMTTKKQVKKKLHTNFKDDDYLFDRKKTNCTIQ